MVSRLPSARSQLFLVGVLYLTIAGGKAFFLANMIHSASLFAAALSINGRSARSYRFEQSGSASGSGAKKHRESCLKRLYDAPVTAWQA